MSQVAKSASALERAFLAMLELEAMEVRCFARSNSPPFMAIVGLFALLSQLTSGVPLGAWPYGFLRFRREILRPCGSGLGAVAPLAGWTKNSESGTSRVLANRSRRSIVGFSACRSSPPT